MHDARLVVALYDYSFPNNSLYKFFTDYSKPHDDFNSMA